ncbi:MAG TPA: hypothetical protein VMF59_17310, partial [Bacteroidota bacterium]|nr:hypothetical protein [Bacteroidota bacterium]
MSVHTCRLVVRAALAICAALAAPAYNPAQTPAREIHRALIAWSVRATGEDSLDQLSLEAICGSMGLQPERIAAEAAGWVTPDSDALLVIPHASAFRLSDTGARAVVAGIERGCVVLTDGASPLTRALEIRHSAPALVADVTDRTNPEIRITWPGRQSAPSFEKYPQASSEIVYAAR